MPYPRLGGFKILQNICYVSIVLSEEPNKQLITIFDTIAYERINLPYVTCVSKDGKWGINLVVEEPDIARLETIFKSLCVIIDYKYNCSIISIFPHRKDPEILSLFLETFTECDLLPLGIASSPSTLSAVMENDLIDEITEGLFSRFSFSAYRTPEDWRLTQKEKETLYKEVVASFQEKRPKVYGLEYLNEQSIISFNISSLKGFLNRLKFKKESLSNIFFISSSPSSMGQDIIVALPMGLQGEGSEAGNVSLFSMSGPHFGDRFGLARLLIKALVEQGLNLIAMNCTVASISWAGTTDEGNRTIDSICHFFDVPSIRCLK